MSKELNIIEASKIKNAEFEIIFPNGDVDKKKVHTNATGAILNAKNEYKNIRKRHKRRYFKAI